MMLSLFDYSHQISVCEVMLTSQNIEFPVTLVLEISIQFEVGIQLQFTDLRHCLDMSVVDGGTITLVNPTPSSPLTAIPSPHLRTLYLSTHRVLYRITGNVF